MATPDVKISIIAIDKASDEIKKVGKSLEGIKKTSKVSMVAMSAAVAIGQGALDLFKWAARKAAQAIRWLARETWDFIKESVRASGQYDTFATSLMVVAKNAGYSRKEVFKTVHAMTESNKSILDATRITEDFIIAGIDLSKANKLVAVTQDVAAARGAVSRDVLNATREAIIQMQPEMLKQYGIQVNLNEAYTIYAEKIGKSASKLTIAERRQAMFNSIMQQGEKYAGAYEKALGTWEKASNSLKGAKIDLMIAIGHLMDRAFAPFLGQLKELRDKVKGFIFTEQGEFTPAVERIADKVKTMVEGPLKAFGNWLLNIDFKAVLSGIEKFVDRARDLYKWVQNKVVPALLSFWEQVQKKVVPVLKVAWDWLVKLIDEYKKTKEAIAKVSEAMGGSGEAGSALAFILASLVGTLIVVQGAVRGVLWVVRKLANTFTWLKDMSHKAARALINAFDTMAREITPVINDIIGVINRMIDTINKVPGVDLPGMGEFMMSARTGGMVRRQQGGMVPGGPGQAVPIIAHGGERIVNPALGQTTTNNMNVNVTLNSEAAVHLFFQKLNEREVASKFGVQSA